MPGEVIVRPLQHKDRPRVRQIACDTAFMGEPCERFFDGRDVMADALSLYYTDFEGESCFVAVAGGEVIGYILGARHVSVVHRIFNQKILLPLLGKAVIQGIFFKKKSIQFLGHVLWSFLRSEFNEPSFAREYPAALHINIAHGARSSGAGSKLIATYLDYLKRAGIAGVHFATFSDSASVFFKQQGFDLLFQTKRSYFWHVISRDVNLYIFGKRLI